MAGLHNSASGGLVGRFLRFSLSRGMRRVEIDPEGFRKELGEKHGLWIPHFDRMKDVPIERIDAIAKKLIRDAGRLAMVEGAGFGLGGMITLIPDAGLLSIITLRLIQRLCLLYGIEAQGRDNRTELWLAAAAATGVDYSKDVVEKQMLERLAPRIIERLAVKLGQEAAEKWVGRLIPLASSAVGGALNFSFVRSWGRRVQRNLRKRRVAEQPPFVPPSAYTSAEVAVA